MHSGLLVFFQYFSFTVSYPPISLFLCLSLLWYIFSVIPVILLSILLRLQSERSRKRYTITQPDLSYSIAMLQSSVTQIPALHDQKKIKAWLSNKEQSHFSFTDPYYSPFPFSSCLTTPLSTPFFVILNYSSDGSEIIRLPSWLDMDSMVCFDLDFLLQAPHTDIVMHTDTHIRTPTHTNARHRNQFLSNCFDVRHSQYFCCLEPCW